MPRPIIKLTGILQLTLDDVAMAQVAALRQGLPAEAMPIGDQDLHVTLWKLDKEERAQLKRCLELGIIDMDALQASAPVVSVIDRIIVVDRPAMVLPNGRTMTSKRAWLALVQPPERLRAWVDGLARQMGMPLSSYEETRPFHISIANLTGSPFDSVGDVTWQEATGDDWAQMLMQLDDDKTLEDALRPEGCQEV